MREVRLSALPAFTSHATARAPEYAAWGGRLSAFASACGQAAATGSASTTGSSVSSAGASRSSSARIETRSPGSGGSSSAPNQDVQPASASAAADRATTCT